jgi:hypothetical protein
LTDSGGHSESRLRHTTELTCRRHRGATATSSGAVSSRRPSGRLRSLRLNAGGRESASYIAVVEHARDLKRISDDELLCRLAELVGESRRVEADLVAHIGEVDTRRLYAREASPSLFAYCTERLHLSEAEAYLRIAAARASREHPVLLEMLRDGRMHLSGIARLAPHLTPDNREALLERATHRSKREIEELVAELAPRPDAPTTVRKLPERVVRTQLATRGSSSPGADSTPSEGGRGSGRGLRPDAVGVSRLPLDGIPIPSPQLGPDTPRLRPDAVVLSSSPSPTGLASVRPLAPARYKVQFTASGELRRKLERLQALMRSTVPDGDLPRIIEVAVTEKLERLESQRFARSGAPRKTLAQTDTSRSSRHIPAAVRRAVYERDCGRCRFVDQHGRRCTASDRLEFHHRHTFAHGGDCSVENIRLMCKMHNQYLAEHDYGSKGTTADSSPAVIVQDQRLTCLLRRGKRRLFPGFRRAAATRSASPASRSPASPTRRAPRTRGSACSSPATGVATRTPSPRQVRPDAGGAPGTRWPLGSVAASACRAPQGRASREFRSVESSDGDATTCQEQAQQCRYEQSACGPVGLFRGGSRSCPSLPALRRCASIVFADGACVQRADPAHPRPA